MEHLAAKEPDFPLRSFCKPKTEPKESFRLTFNSTIKYVHLTKPAIKTTHFSRSKALCHRNFQQFLFDIQAEYGDVVHHNDVSLLSRRSELQRFYSLRGEIKPSGQPMPELSDPVWLADLGFLVDTTKHLNTLIMSLQGQNAVASQLYSHIKAFGTKLQLFQRHLLKTQPNTTNFPGNNDQFSTGQYRGGMQQTWHLWLRSLNYAFGILKPFKRRSGFSPVTSPLNRMMLRIGCSVTASGAVDTSSPLL